MPEADSPPRDPTERIFRLLVPASALTPAEARSVELAGSRWIVTDRTVIPTAGTAPPYTCISYVWGADRVANPFEDGHVMSGRTLRAIEATITALRPAAIWVDALCVPSEEPARAACLRNLGTIYGSAAQVAAILSEPCAPVLQQIESAAAVNPAMLDVLEHDDWVTRAWTYQEIVNSASIHFVAELGGSISVKGDDLLNAVGMAIADYKKAHGLDSFGLRSVYPNLDGLEDLLADWMTGAYLERSAYQAMSAMGRRFAERSDDKFNAMIGAISAAPLEDDDAAALDPAEYFMRACEAKGDYSFIYCTAPRSPVPGRRWRPLAGPISAILPWHSFGDGQAGSLQPNHLLLNDMCFMRFGTATSTAAQFIQEWLRGDNVGTVSGSSPDLVFQRLKQADFLGCADPLELENGYFFPQSMVAPVEDLTVVVAAGVRWVHGAPGLLLSRDGRDVYRFRDVGVFVGPVPHGGEPINVG